MQTNPPNYQIALKSRAENLKSSEHSHITSSYLLHVRVTLSPRYSDYILDPLIKKNVRGIKLKPNDNSRLRCECTFGP